MKKDSMMDKKQEEPTPDSQRVTWGNRVATILMIGVVWFLVRLVSELSGTGWQGAFWSMSLIFGAFAATLGLVIALFSSSRKTQAWYRCFAWSVIPFTFFSGDSNSTPPSWVSLTVQFSYLLILHVGHYLFRRRGS